MLEYPQDRKVPILNDHMNHPRLTYRVSPSFDESQKLEIDMKWNVAADAYSAHITCEFGRRKKLIPKEESLQLLHKVENLRLAPVTEDKDGLDGTTYELSIGSVTNVSLRWWQQLPKEWQELAPIIQLILEATKE